jgi:effector-binding domain-containing protein
MILNYFFKLITRALIVLLILNTNIMANEQPDYTVIKKDNGFEIRQYTNFLTATVETEGERDDAIGKGFRILFKYISGENKNKESISMTVPVMQKSSGNNKWSISFVVPKKFNLQNVPQPDNQSVKIKNNPDLKVIVITFSGLFSNENIKENEAKIRNYIKEKGLKIEEPAIYAGYNSPWTLWFLKRNEVLFKLVT